MTHLATINRNSDPSPVAALTVAQLDSHGPPSADVFTAGFFGNGWDSVIRGVLGKSARGGADIGEVLSVCASVAPGDVKGWFTAWRDLGERILLIAHGSAKHGHNVSASRAYLRAADYFALAVNAIDGRAIDTNQLQPTFRRHAAAWHGFITNTRWPVERIDLPYEGKSMPGWFFRPDASGSRRRTLVINNGSDGSLSGCWTQAGEGALERGYNVLMFDGPGQQSMLFERDVPFRHDWEAVLTPIVDVLVDRADVDPTALAVYGISQAGYWVPRAIAFEHRFAAAIADGGAVSLARAWFEQLPPELTALYQAGQKAEFDQALQHALSDPDAQRTWEFRSRPYGVTGYSEVLDEITKYDLTDIAAQINTPLYVIDPDGEQYLPGQPAELVDLVKGSTHARFTQNEGASYHCQPLARELTEQRMFDWLDEQLPAPTDGTDRGGRMAK
jgi:dienelactone hydrolase